MTEISSTAHRIPVPHQTIGQARGQQAENLLDNEALRTQFDFVGEDARTAWQNLTQGVVEKAKGPTQEMIDQQIAKQNAVPVHSVFRSDGKIVAVLNQNGGVTSSRGIGSVDMSGNTDDIAQRVYERLSQLYGSVQMEPYSNTTAVTTGMAEGEMFGKAPPIPSPEEASSHITKTGYMSSLLKFSSESIALIQFA